MECDLLVVCAISTSLSSADADRSSIYMAWIVGISGFTLWTIDLEGTYVVYDMPFHLDTRASLIPVSDNLIYGICIIAVILLAWGLLAVNSEPKASIIPICIMSGIVLGIGVKQFWGRNLFGWNFRTSIVGVFDPGTQPPLAELDCSQTAQSNPHARPSPANGCIHRAVASNDYQADHHTPCFPSPDTVPKARTAIPIEAEVVKNDPRRSSVDTVILDNNKPPQSEGDHASPSFPETTSRPNTRLKGDQFYANTSNLFRVDAIPRAQIPFNDPTTEIGLPKFPNKAVQAKKPP